MFCSKIVIVTMWTTCADEMFFQCSISNHAEDICKFMYINRINFHYDYAENILIMKNSD